MLKQLLQFNELVKLIEKHNINRNTYICYFSNKWEFSFNGKAQVITKSDNILKQVYNYAVHLWGNSEFTKDLKTNAMFND